MATLDELIVRIRADASQLEREMKKVEGTVSKTGKEVSSKLDRAGSSVMSLTAQFTALAGIVAGGKIVESITTFEKIGASLRTVTGSAEQAGLAFDMIQKFAATTPYSVEQVAEAFIKLRALGLEPSEEALRSYGNTATAMGKTINQMIEAVADASTGEFERLKEFGIKTKDAGDSVVFTFQGIATTVKKDSAEIEAYLRSIGDVQFGNAMAEQQGTLSAALSNMGDSFQNLAKAIGDAGLTDILIGISREIDNLTKSVTENMPKFQLGFQKMVGEAIKPFVDADIAAGIDSEIAGRADAMVAGTGGKKYVAPKTKSSPFSKTAKAKKPKAEKGPEDYDEKGDALSEYIATQQQELELSQLSGRALAVRRAELEATNIAIRDGNLPSQEMLETIKSTAGATYEAEAALKKLNDAQEAAARFNADLKDRFSDTFSSIILNVKSAGDALGQFAEQMAKLVIEKKITGPLTDSLGSLIDNSDIGKSVGGFFGDLFGGARASGGPVANGLSYLVGEKGPEIFTPSASGYITPNHKLGGGNTFTQVLNISPGLPETVNTAIRNAAPQIAAAAKAMVLDAAQRGGNDTRMLRGT